MKKTAVSFSLLLALLGGCLTGCDVKHKKIDGKQVLFTVGETEVVADDLLGFEDQGKLSYDFLKTDEGVQAVYEAIYNAIAQKNVEITKTIEGAVEERMDDFDEEVENLASSDGTTTRKAEKTKLEQLGLEDREELKNYFTILEQKEELANMFEKENMEPETDKTDATLNGKSMLENYVKETSPMIVKHVLVNVADSCTLYEMGEITKEEVDKLTSVMQRLALGKASRNSFKSVAVEESEDTTASKGGNLGIMDTYTSFVNEFKLGLYVNELINNNECDPNDTFGAKEFEDRLFGADGVYANGIRTINVATIGAVLAYVEADQAKDEQKAAGHTKTSEYDVDLYPRNIIYNKYLNTPAIANLRLDLSNAEIEIDALLAECYPHMDGVERAAKVQEVMNSTYFQALQVEANQLLNNNKLVLDGENGKPVVLAKSSYGFHFLSTTWTSVGKEAKEAVEYFMYNNTLNASTLTYVKDTQYNFGYSTVTVGQNARKTEIKNRVLNYVEGGYGDNANKTLLDYKIFEYYLANGNVTIKDATLKTEVEKMIANERAIKATSISESIYDAWDSYVNSIEACQEQHARLYA